MLHNDDILSPSRKSQLCRVSRSAVQLRSHRHANHREHAQNLVIRILVSDQLTASTTTVPSGTSARVLNSQHNWIGLGFPHWKSGWTNIFSAHPQVRSHECAMLYHDRRNPVSRTMEASRCADRMILALSFRSKGGWRSGAARKISVEEHSSYCRDNDYWRCLHDMHAGSEEVYKDSQYQQHPATPIVFEMQAPKITHHTDKCYCCKYSVVGLPIDQRLPQPYLIAGEGWGDPQIRGLRAALQFWGMRKGSCRSSCFGVWSRD
jgi:hypothetical protein